MHVGQWQSHNQDRHKARPGMVRDSHYQAMIYQLARVTNAKTATIVSGQACVHNGVTPWIMDTAQASLVPLDRSGCL